jgi:hypothetical protein
MSVATEPVTGEEIEQIEAGDQVEVEPVESEEVQPDPDAGAKSALVAERKARKAAEKAFADFKADLETKAKPADEQAIDTARREATALAMTAANLRILKSDLKTAAKGRLADPTDAHLYIDLADFDVNDDGDVDPDALELAIDELIARKPHLAAAAARKFNGEADQGAKREVKPSQLTENDIQSMTPADVNKARREGRLNTLLGVK